MYYGEGRGKTSTAAGSLIRSWGHYPFADDYLWVQFLKQSSQSSGETNFIKEHLSIPVMSVNPAVDCEAYHTLTTHTRKKVEKQLKDFWKERRRIISRHYRLVVLDEILDVLKFDVFSAKDLIAWLKQLPADDVILTGHACIPALYREADYVTEFMYHRHPWGKEVPPRKGVEY